MPNSSRKAAAWPTSFATASRVCASASGGKTVAATPVPLAEPLQQLDRTCVRHRGRKLIYFGGCEYFRLSSDPRIVSALANGLTKFGLNVAASRSTTGNHALFAELEDALARFFRQPWAALFSSGYVTNLAFAQTFSGEFTHAFIDERAHGSVRDAAALLACRAQPFRHRDAADLQSRLKGIGRKGRPLVLTDGMFAHDGSLAPLDRYVKALPARGLILVDDAHGAGIVGRNGQGTPEACGVRDERVIQTVSLSKALGVYGGAVLGAKHVVKAIQERSRIFNGNTPLPLPLAFAALAALRMLGKSPVLLRRLRANTARIKDRLAAAGFPIVKNDSPIVALVPRDASHAARLRRQLLRRGIFPTLIHYPGGPAQGFFRFALSSEHTDLQLDLLTEALLDDLPGEQT
jgi:8-amino-7-oxononanoate synthase